MQLDPLWNCEKNLYSNSFNKEKICLKCYKNDQIANKNLQNDLTNLNQKLITDSIDKSLLKSNCSLQFDINNNNNFLLNKCINQSEKTNKQNNLPLPIDQSIILSQTLEYFFFLFKKT